jgi:hypothetical protein
MLRELEYDAQNNISVTNAWKDDHAVGWGVALSAAYNLTSDMTLHGSVTKGDGMGGYVNGAPIFTPGYVNGSGELKTIKEVGYTMSATYKVGPGKVGLGYGQVKLDMNDAAKTTTFTSGPYNSTSSAFLNYLWSPLKNITYGIETGYSTVGKVGGSTGDEVSVEAAVLYSF